jgi:hypothetical protein
MTYGSMTVKIPADTYEKKQKAMFALRLEDSNFSKKMTEIIEEYAKRFDEQNSQKEEMSE